MVGGHLRQLVDAFKHLGCITQAKGKTAARGWCGHGDGQGRHWPRQVEASRREL